jgi:alginate O-acetyltransferase complex protein AlgI
LAFVSLPFVAFVSVLLSVYFLLRQRGQNVLLALASLFFIVVCDRRAAVILVLGTLLDYALSRKLRWDLPAPVRRRALWASICGNVGLLLALRYVGSSAVGSSAWLQLGAGKPLMAISASFYALQRLTHTFDAYYRFIEPADSLLDFGLFVGFFPQLVAGPIERARNMLPQLALRRSFDMQRFHEACWLIGVGLFKKVYIADHFALATKQLWAAGATGSENLLGIYVYALQLYADFAGYSDMARGVARLFGLSIVQNFDAPYLAQSIADYWRRWHISLSSWLEDYVTEPSLMALRPWGTAGLIAAVWITFILSGLWHGKGSTFLVWGAIHAAGLSVYTLTRKPRKRLKKRMPPRLMAALSGFVTFHFVCFALVFFRAPTVRAAVSTLDRLKSAPVLSRTISAWALELALYTVALLVLDRAQTRTRDEFWIFKRPTWQRALCYGVVLFCVLRFPAPIEDFIYADF